MGESNLYEVVRAKLCDEIYYGQYRDGDRLPSERELMDKLGVSRVTVRKSLELMEEDLLVSREVGKGTSVTFHNFGNAGELDMIVLIAPARNAFFSEFIGKFQGYAARAGSLLLYAEKPEQEDLEDCLYRLYKRGLRNAVIWPEDTEVDPQKLCRLRALGMNMVFFDTDLGLPYADCVSVDNAHAVQTLLDKLKEQGCRAPVYLGWDLERAYSIRIREETFCALQAGRCVRLPWKEPAEAAARIRNILQELAAEKNARKPAAVLCSDAECGRITARIVREDGFPVRVATIDALSPAEQCGGMLMYAQDLSGSVERIVRALGEQCRKGSAWKAELYRIRGDENGHPQAAPVSAR